MDVPNTRVIVRAPGNGMSIDGHGVPFVAGNDLNLQRVSKNEYEIRHRDLDFGAASPDYLVGDIPILFVSTKVESLKVMELPPPPPFTRTMVSRMYECVSRKLGEASGHDAVGGRESLTGFGGPGANELHVEFLNRVVGLAISLLNEWPKRHVGTLRWGGAAVGGGREDFKATVRNPRISRFHRTRHGLTVPERSARRAMDLESWTSLALSLAAADLGQRVCDRYVGIAGTDVPLIALLRTVAQHAKPANREPSTPISTWPPLALQLYMAIRQAIAVLNSETASETAYVPAVLMWRLYEHWIGAELLPSDGYASRLQVGQREGVDWYAAWVEMGVRHVLLAQPRIGARNNSFGGMLFDPVKSITSLLIPDYLLQTFDGDEVQTTAVDCKRRSPYGLDARDIAEAGSKYAWGLSVGEKGSRRVDKVSIVTSAVDPPEMNDQSAKIVASRALPSGATPLWRQTVLGARKGGG